MQPVVTALMKLDLQSAQGNPDDVVRIHDAIRAGNEQVDGIDPFLHVNELTSQALRAWYSKTILCIAAAPTASVNAKLKARSTLEMLGTHEQGPENLVDDELDALMANSDVEVKRHYQYSKLAKKARQPRTALRCEIYSHAYLLKLHPKAPENWTNMASHLPEYDKCSTVNNILSIRA